MFLSGCNAFNRFEDGGATVFVFATHHATPEDGGFPGRGEDNSPRIFDNTEGWQVTLVEGYVTISSVTLISCSGAEYPLDMFWGPCPEDLRDEDLATLTVAGTRVPEGNYCTVRVDYSAYQTPVIDESMEETRHETPASDNVEGATIYLRGLANPPDGSDGVPFELVSDAPLSVNLDLTNIEGPGRPLNIAHREDFPKELLVSKTYDRFFDGVDFANLTAEAAEMAESELPELLEDETRVSLGTTVSLDED